MRGVWAPLVLSLRVNHRHVTNTALSIILQYRQSRVLNQCRQIIGKKTCSNENNITGRGANYMGISTHSGAIYSGNRTIVVSN